MIAGPRNFMELYYNPTSEGRCLRRLFQPGLNWGVSIFEESIFIATPAFKDLFEPKSFIPFCYRLL